MSKTMLSVPRVSNGAEREHARQPSGWPTRALHAAPRSLDFMLVASGKVFTETMTSFRFHCASVMPWLCGRQTEGPQRGRHHIYGYRPKDEG